MRPSFFKKRKRSVFLDKFFFSNSIAGKPDYVLLLTIFIIIVLGLFLLASASSVESFRQQGSAYFYFFRQILRGFLPGLLAFWLFYRLDYKKLEKYSLLFLVASVMLLILVFVPGIGQNYNGAQSWIKIFGLSFQPTEIIKILLVLFFSSWFSQRGREMNKDFWNGLIPFALILGIISLLVAKQPDYGTLLVISLIGLIMYFVAGGSLRHIIGLTIVAAGTLGMLIAQAPYRAARFMTFLHPEFDPQGVGYHINQAFLAIGSGGIFGLGFGQSRQKFAYLPEAIGDSIFAVIAEELGFIFCLFLIFLFLILLFRGFKLSQRIQDDYGRYLTTGIVSWFTLQAFLNIAAMVGLMPLTGIPLPFISYGGTALLSVMAASGILLNISSHVSLKD